MDINNQQTTGNVVTFPGPGNVANAAVSRAEIIPFVQSILELKTGRITGLEFLARRRDPLRGNVQEPVEFMPGMSRREIIQLDMEMAHAVIRFHEDTWNQLHGKMDLHLNVSTELLCDAQSASRLCEKLQGTPFLMQSLVIEVLESPGLNQDALTHLQNLRNLGARIALDDFGAGYSSYERLVDCPLDRIKLDRGLTAHLPHNPRANQVVMSILALAQQFGLSVVAEGIECPKQHAWLLANGCQLGQGFLWGQPTAAAQLAEQLNARAETTTGTDLSMVTFAYGD